MPDQRHWEARATRRAEAGATPAAETGAAWVAEDDVLPGIAAMGAFDEPDLVARAVASVANDIAASIEGFSRRDEGYRLDVPVEEVARRLVEDMQGCVLDMLGERSLMRFGHVELGRARLRTPDELAAVTRGIVTAQGCARVAGHLRP